MMKMTLINDCMEHNVKERSVMRKSSLSAILIAALILLPFSAFGQIIRVPSDQTTIQAGIDAAVDGDIVLVAPDTYVENIDFLGKAITVQSEAGADSTIIDGGQIDSVVAFTHDESEDTELIGFTITNGNSEYGGGIYSCESSPKIEYCTISKNNADIGGGICCYVIFGPPRFKQRWLIWPTITNCTISDNNSISGGGVYCFFSSPTIENCQIVGNIARDGGGIYGDDTAVRIKNCIITGNSADRYGGGIRSAYSFPSIINCAITGNSASHGGGIACSQPHEDMSPRIYNSILWGDSASEGPEIWIVEYGFVPTLTISFSDIQGGLEAVYSEYGWLDWGQGNIDADPLFIGPADYHLSSGSSCIDAGNSNPSYNDACFPPSMGTERNDMGAYGGPGACGWIEPTFTLDLDASYDAGSLNLTYTVSTSEPAMWTNFAVLTYPEIQVVPLWTVPLPGIDPPVVFPLAFPFPSLGWVGIYAGLFTAEGPQAVELVWVNTG